MKVREAIKIIESHGWEMVRMRGDHRTFKHPDNQRLITISGTLSDDITPGVWNSARRVAGLK